jgi:hypothetical protein
MSMSHFVRRVGKHNKSRWENNILKLNYVFSVRVSLDFCVSLRGPLMGFFERVGENCGSIVAGNFMRS